MLSDRQHEGIDTMTLNLPIQVSVDRSLLIDPFVISDPEGSDLDILYGALPGDPSPLLRSMYGLVTPCPQAGIR
jgi:hypothetical protein